MDGKLGYLGYDLVSPGQDIQTQRRPIEINMRWQWNEAKTLSALR